MTETARPPKTKEVEEKKKEEQKPKPQKPIRISEDELADGYDMHAALFFLPTEE